MRRIGVLTGGGDCPGLNAVIRAIVKTATYHGLEVLGIEDGFDGLIKPGRVRSMTNEDVRGILPRGGTILGTTNRGDPFNYRVRKGDRVEMVDLSQEVVRRVRELGIDALLLIGGDGTLTIGERLFRMGVPIIGVPKTIDNDLAATDITFGFDTALNTAMEAIDRLHTTAESHHRVMVVEVMGRHAGWIALEAGLAGGADVILIPEIPFRVEAVAAQVARREAAGRSFSIAVVAEGAAAVGGSQHFVRAGDPLTAPRLGGVGNWLAEQLAHLTEREIRVTVLGHLQRGGSPTAFDRLLGTRYGTAAVKLALEGGFGRMVALRTPHIVSVPLEEAVATLRRVPPDGELVATARCLGIAFGDEPLPGRGAD